ncbi:hypothetical protein WMF37_18555 [Sorangium sp. So ce291]|uniref:hypothetical protein n=1 Tax=Sorangium sp. So ce291 TaxID=3133294 RepID=UPI003F602C5F
MAEVLADLLERPATAPPAGDERAGAAVAEEVVLADRAGDAGGGEVAVEEVDLLLLAEAGEESEEDDQAIGLGDGVAGAEAVLFFRLQVGPGLDGGVAGAALGGLLDALSRAATGFAVMCWCIASSSICGSSPRTCLTVAGEIGLSAR